MNKIPKIIKRQPPEATQEVTNWVFSPEEPPASELVEPVKVPTPPEQLEALYVPPLSTPTLKDWQREFREIEWQDDADAWKSQLYD